MRMTLGPIIFDNKNIINGLSGSFKYRWAHHEGVDGAPKSQFLGEDLKEYTIKAYFHADFCNPQQCIDDLDAAAASGEIMPFTAYNGKYYGDYVIETISPVYEQTLSDGTLLSGVVDIAIKKYSAEDPVIVETKTPRTGDKKKTDSDSMGSGAASGSDTKKVVRQE